MVLLSFFVAAKAQHGVLQYYIFGTLTGEERYSILSSGQETNYSATARSAYFNTISKTVHLSLSPQGKLLSIQVKGSSFAGTDTVSSQTSDGPLPLALMVNEPLPVSLAGLYIRRSSVNGRNQPGGPDVICHGTDHLNGVTGRLRCYSLGGLTWGRCFLWLNKDGQVVAAACPLAAYTLFAIDRRSATALPALESAYAKRGTEYYRRQMKPVNANKLTAIRHVTLWDGRSDQVQENMTVLFSEARILYAGPDSAFQGRADTVIEGRGMTLLPGLWEMHTHLRQPEWLPASMAAGIIALRDMGNNFSYIQTLAGITNARRTCWPHIFRAGWIDARGNWPFQYSGMQANTRAEAIHWVKTYQQAGFDQIKIWENPSPEVIRTIISEAHQRNMEVVGHIPERFSFSSIMEAGTNEISHLSEIIYAYKDDSLYHSIPAIVSLFKTHRVRADPTMVVLDIGWRNKARPLKETEPGAAAAHPVLVKTWEAFGVDSLRNATRGKEVIRETGALVVSLYRAGVPVVAGADGGIPGHSFHRELELYVEAGLTPMEAIRTATRIPAQVMSKEPDQYLVKEGNLPDFILVEGNPFQQIRDIRRVRYTIINGHLYDTRHLWSMAGFGVL